MDEISTGISRRGFVLGGRHGGRCRHGRWRFGHLYCRPNSRICMQEGLPTFHVLLISSRAAAKPPRTSQDRRDGEAGRSNEMRRRILRDGRILNCQTGVDPTRAVNGDCGGDRLGQGRD